MPYTRLPILSLLITLTACTYCLAIDSGNTAVRNAGFYMPDSVTEVTLRYKRVDNLILIPVTINDSVRVNLILDTGCRNVVLFGRRFMKEFEMHPQKRVEFSGLGSGGSVSGRISLNNKVAIDAVVGERIPVVIVPDPNLFGAFSSVDGVIGYDIFIKFEVEFHSNQRLITFRPAQTATLSDEYNLIPIRIEDSRPIVKSTLSLYGRVQSLDVMIDTGSSLGLLLKSDNRQQYPAGRQAVLGRGLNGLIEGTTLQADGLALAKFQFKRLAAGVVYTDWSSTSSIGMDVLSNYSMVLNYCKGYAGLKRDISAFAGPNKRTQPMPDTDF
jgi:hypothetical protein